MAGPVNLRRARKQRARDAARAQGTTNAARTGVSKAVRSLTEARQAQAEARLDGHHRDPAGTPPDGTGPGQ